MCVGIPMQVIDCDMATLRARCRDATAPENAPDVEVDMALVGAQPPGTWVVVMLNVAREVVDEGRAMMMRDALAAVRQVMAGGAPDVEALFADLIDREPPLPPHLAAQVPGGGANGNGGDGKA